MRFFLFIIAGMAICLLSEAQNSKLIVGTYTTNSTSKGIYVFDFNASTGKATLVSTTATADPSFLALSPNKKFLYAVNELGEDKGGGTVSAFSFDSSKGRLQFINKQSSYGNHPCYVSIDKKGKTVFAGNYSSGNFASFRVAKDGGLNPATINIKHTGSGPNKERQEAPHVHSTVLSPNNRWLFVTDLGTDKIHSYPFDAASGKLIATGRETVVPAGAGPRHMAFNKTGTRLYVVAELNGVVMVYDHKDGELTLLQIIHSLPPNKQSPANSADIHLSPDGLFLYATHRINNTIAAFAVDATAGTLTHIETVSTNGNIPRNFTIDPSGKFLLVAHQNSDNIVVFKRDSKTGKLTDTGERIEAGKPVCLIWSN
jgi:6-phosphogluconolactonase